MLNLMLKNGQIYIDGKFEKADMLIERGTVTAIGNNIKRPTGCPVADLSDLYILPGFADVHVHLREPGFSYKETVASGTQAAAKGGFTLVCPMPNLNPVPDRPENLKKELEIIRKDALITTLPYASITLGERGEKLSDMAGMAKYCFAFSDDGKGVQNRDMMQRAMETAAKLGKAIVAHCEDESLLNGGYIHDGEYARLHGHRGICSESETRPVERDIRLAAQTGVHYHVCHVSAKETVEAVRKAKARGVNVTCETGPHYLAFTDMDLQEDGRWKMNPPIRSARDRQALIEGIQDGTIDCIITDHAPHSVEEKSRGLEKSSMGVVGLETSYAAVNTYMVEKGYISFEKLVEIMSINPRKIFGLPRGIKVGAKADFTVVNRTEEWVVDPEKFVSMGRATPFTGEKLVGNVEMTVSNGRLVYKK